MQKLHLVGITTDHRGLIFSVRRNAKSGGYTIELDASLLTAIDELKALTAEETAEELPPADTRPESSLSVREMQARLRRGRTIDQVAREAGVDASWIARFAVPVIAEQAEIVRAARGTKMTKLRVGLSGATLGDAVHRNLADRGVTDPRDQLDKGWSAKQLTEGAWLVAFKYTSRGRVCEASWEYDSAAGLLKARGRLGTLLGYREPRRAPRPAAAPAKPARRATPVKKTTPTSRKAQVRSAKKLSAARKAATARMVSDAERATKRNVAMARKAAQRPIGLPPVRYQAPPPPPPPPDPEPELEEPDPFDEPEVVVEDAAQEPEVDPDVDPDDEPVEPEPEMTLPERPRRRVFVRATPGEVDDTTTNGPMFRSDLARPARERATYPTSQPPLTMPEPIERPARRRRTRPLRGR